MIHPGGYRKDIRKEKQRIRNREKEREVNRDRYPK